MPRKKKPRLGRPRVDSEAITVRIRRPVLNALDRHIEEDKRALTRPEAIRELLADSLISLGVLKNE